MHKQQRNLHLINQHTLLKLFICLAIVIFYNGCAEKRTPTLFDDVVDHYGGSNVFNSIISYSSGSFDYKIDRSNYRTEIIISRLDKDSILYTTKLKDRHITEFINNVEQPSRIERHASIIKIIEGFVYSNSIPHVLTANDIEITQLDDAIVNSQTYNVIYAKTKFVEDIEISHFYLYIDPESRNIIFSVEDYSVASEIPILKKFYNHRTVNGIRFADHIPFISRETIPLQEMIRFFSEDYFKPLKEVTFDNISVSYQDN